MRIGEWLRRSRVEASEAWRMLWESLRTAAPGVAAGGGFGMRMVEEDAVPEALARLLEDAGPLRRASPEVSLGSFAWGYLRNVARELSRKRQARPRLEGVPDRYPGWAVDRGPALSRTSPDLSILTEKQREAVLLLREGNRVSEVARALGISRGAARDRLARAHRRLRKAREGSVPWSPWEAGRAERSRRRPWVKACLDHLWESLCAQTRNVIFLYAQAVPEREIARWVGLSEEAVKGRLKRARTRLRRRGLLPESRAEPNGLKGRGAARGSSC